MDKQTMQCGSLCVHAAEIEQLTNRIERLQALLVRYQAANYIPEDCDLHAETKAALEQSTTLIVPAHPYDAGCTCNTCLQQNPYFNSRR